MKKTVRLTALLLLVCMLLSALCACGGKGDVTDVTDETDKKTESTQAPVSPKIVLFDPENAENAYKIVYPAAGAEGMQTLLSSFEFAFEEKFGKAPEKAADTEAAPEKSILLGIDPAALGENAFAIRMNQSGSLSITGRDDGTLAAAARKFLSDFVWSADGAVAIAPDYESVCEKRADPITANADGSYDVQLADMKVIGAADTGYAYTDLFAQAFASRLSLFALGGVEYGNDAEEPAGAEILIGCGVGQTDNARVLARRENYVPSAKPLSHRDFWLCVRNNCLTVDAVSAFGYESAFNYLYEAMKAGRLTIPADGLFVGYDYGDTQLGKILKNFESPFAEGGEPVAVGHRGCFASNEKYPENSIASYNFCIENHVDVIETDLRKTKDGHWVLCHDDRLIRTTSGERKVTNNLVSRVTLAEIKTLYLLKGSGNGTAVTKERMPSLEEIIEIGRGKVLYNLDKLDFAGVKEVYDIFEALNAVECILYKTSDSVSAEANAQWYADLIAQGRKLPMAAMMNYGNSAALITFMNEYKGMISMVETGSDLYARADLAQVLETAKATNIRPMILTLDENASIDGKKKWDTIINAGITGIMTNFAVRFSKEYHKGA